MRYRQLGVSSSKAAIADLCDNTTAFCRMARCPGSDAYTVLHADGTGSKALLTDWHNPHDVCAIVRDAMVMNTDDMACVGVTDNFVVSTIINRNPAVVDDVAVRNIIGAVRSECNNFRNMGITITECGGETADVPEMVTSLTLDMSMTAQLPVSRLVDNANIRPGDVIIGLASYGQAAYEDSPNSGVACNGLTWLRHDLPIANPDILHMLKSPTRTFLPIIRDVLANPDITVHGMIHITGGGHTKSLKATRGLRIVKDNMLAVPAVFQMIADRDSTALPDLYRVFNMGQLFEIYTPPQHAQALVDISHSYGVEAQVVGYTCPGSGMLLSTPYGTFEYEI